MSVCLSWAELFGKVSVKTVRLFPRMKWGGENQFVCREKKRSSNNHLMEKFSQPHALEQDLKALGEDSPYIRPVAGTPHTYLASSCFWPTSNPALTSGTFTGYLLYLSSLKISLLQMCSGLAQLLQAEKSFSGASLPGICLPQPWQSFSRSLIYLLSLSPQTVLKPRRSEGRQRHEEPFPLLPRSSSHLFLALQSQSVPADVRALFRGGKMLTYSYREQKMLCSSA